MQSQYRADYDSTIKTLNTLKIKTHKIQQSVSREDGIIRSKSYLSRISVIFNYLPHIIVYITQVLPYSAKI